MEFDKLKELVQKCQICKQDFGFDPHPIFWGDKNSKIVQISQAPSRTVHKFMVPFSDASGKTLKYEWYHISDEEFYDTKNFFIGAMAHCYPGKDKNGNDKAPPKCCFDRWIKEEIKTVNNIIYIIIGAKAAKAFFGNKSFEELVFNDQEINGKKAYVLPHPSPLNRKWINNHPLFLEKRIIEIRKVIKRVLLH